MRLFTAALLLGATALGASAQEMIFEEDFSWLKDVPGSADMAINDNQLTMAWADQAKAGVKDKNPGWLQCVFDLNADHTVRLSPNKTGADPNDIFSEVYNATYMRPGYLKFGYTNFAGAILTPELTKMGDRTGNIEVTFQLAGYTSAAGAKDAADVMVGLWDNCAGEMDDADYEQVSNGWTYECKKFTVTNYFNSDAKEYGENHDPWNKDISLYTVKVNNVNSKTRLNIYFGGYGTEIKSHTADNGYPTTITQTINGEEKTFPYKANINRVGMKGCWIKLLSSTAIGEVESDLDAPVTYVNLQGMPVAEPAKGQIVIKRQGNTAKKIRF